MVPQNGSPSVCPPVVRDTEVTGGRGSRLVGAVNCVRKRIDYAQATKAERALPCQAWAVGALVLHHPSVISVFEPPIEVAVARRGVAAAGEGQERVGAV